MRRIAILSWVFSLVGCVTPAEERQIKDDIARLQAQMVEIQNSGSTFSVKSNQRAASTNTKVERLHIDVQKIKGEIEALRIGVLTGQLPGSTDDDGPSMARKLSAVLERLESIEATQKKLMSVIEKADKPAKSKKKTSSRESKRKLSALREAFKAKRYKHVKEDAPFLIKRFKKGTKNRQEVQFLYAESLYKLGDIKSAALEFDEFIKSNPKDRLAHANLRLGDCFRHLGDSATAKIYYDELIAKFGSSDEAKTATERLEKLKI